MFVCERKTIWKRMTKCERSRGRKREIGCELGTIRKRFMSVWTNGSVVTNYRNVSNSNKGNDGIGVGKVRLGNDSEIAIEFPRGNRNRERERYVARKRKRVCELVSARRLAGLCERCCGEGNAAMSVSGQRQRQRKFACGRGHSRQRRFWCERQT